MNFFLFFSPPPKLNFYRPSHSLLKGLFTLTVKVFFFFSLGNGFFRVGCFSVRNFLRLSLRRLSLPPLSQKYCMHDGFSKLGDTWGLPLLAIFPSSPPLFLLDSPLPYCGLLFQVHSSLKYYTPLLMASPLFALLKWILPFFKDICYFWTLLNLHSPFFHNASSPPPFY